MCRSSSTAARSSSTRPGTIGGRLASILCVGVAYFVLAVLIPVALMAMREDATPNWKPNGLVFSGLAGVMGASAAICVIFASKAAVDVAKIEGINPATYRVYIAPLIFCLAPLINTLLSLIWHPKPGEPFNFEFEMPGWKLVVGILLMAAGTFLVLKSKEDMEAGKAKHAAVASPQPGEHIMSRDWHGVFPAVCTQFKSDESLDIAATLKHIDAMLAAGIHGFVMLGSVGENTTLETGEKKELLAATVKHVAKRVPVLTGVAEYTTKQACATAAMAKECGADGLMVLPPMVYKPDRRETVAHFRAVAKATPLPIMIYNNPPSYRTDVTPEMFADLADEPRVHLHQGIERQPAADHGHHQSHRRPLSHFRRRR